MLSCQVLHVALPSRLRDHHWLCQLWLGSKLGELHPIALLLLRLGNFRLVNYLNSQFLLQRKDKKNLNPSIAPPAMALVCMLFS